jgi:hypothetical protein
MTSFRPGSSCSPSLPSARSGRSPRSRASARTACSRRHAAAGFALDLARERALDYYNEACLSISLQTAQGETLELADGGFTDWTQQLLGNRKERLLISGIGLERLAGALT